jgi:hypothetical protein
VPVHPYRDWLSQSAELAGPDLYHECPTVKSGRSILAKLLYLCEFVTHCYKNGKSAQRKSANVATQLKTILDTVQLSGESARHLRKEIVMDTIGSIAVVVLVLAAIFVPQALALYFSDSRKSEVEEYIPDGR